MSRYKFTLDVDSLDALEALEIAADFLAHFPDNHRITRPERHGVIYSKSNGRNYYAYGNKFHVRVRESVQNSEDSAQT